MEQKTLCSEGVVQKIEGHYVYVLMQINSACAGCHAKSICIPSQSKNELLKIKNSENVAFLEGEKVFIEMEQKLGGKALRIGFLYPFIILMTLIILIYKITSHDLLTAFSALTGVILYYFSLYLLNKRKKIDNQFVFHIRKDPLMN